MNVVNTKKQLRKQMRQIRDGMLAFEREEKSKEIVARFLTLPEIKQVTTIYCYVSFRSEVNTMPLLHSLWELGKCVAVPRIDENQMQFYEIASMDDLEVGYYGILEPKNACQLAQKAELVVMPGLAFDEKGHRLGYGGGFYDKYLETIGECKKIALAFSEQMIEDVPVEGRDIVVEKIVTEERIYELN